MARRVSAARPAPPRSTFTVGPLHSAVRQAAIVTSEESRGVDFTFDAGTLVLSGRAAEVGQSRVELPIGYDGPPISITLDPRYVNDFLKVLDAEKTFTLRTERRRKRRRLHHRRRLRLRDHAAGPRPLIRLPTRSIVLSIARSGRPLASGVSCGDELGCAMRPGCCWHCCCGCTWQNRNRLATSWPSCWPAAAMAGCKRPMLVPPPGSKRPARRWPPSRGPGRCAAACWKCGCTNSTLVQELSFEKTRLLKTLAQLVPDEKIRDLKFRVGPID